VRIKFILFYQGYDDKQSMYRFATANVFWCMRLFVINKKPGEAFILTGFGTIVQIAYLHCVVTNHGRLNGNMIV